MSESYQIVEYNTTAAALDILRAKYTAPFDVSTSKGMSQAREARTEIRGYRTALEKLRVELKAPALERTRLIDAEAKRITAELLKIEEPISQQIKEEEARKEAEREEKRKAESLRLACIHTRIYDIAALPSRLTGKSAIELRAALESALIMEINAAEFDEFAEQARATLAKAQEEITALLMARVEFEAEEARLQAEREAEEARLQAEREALARLRAEEEARKAEQARIDAEARKAHEAEQARLQAEREALDARQRQIEEAERRTEAEEQARLQAEREAKAKPKTKPKAKAPLDPLADLKQAIDADDRTAQAIDEAYQRGFQAGISAARQAA